MHPITSRRLRCALLGLAAMWGAAITASAATTSDEDTISAAGPIVLDKFDPSLGTLQQVIFESSFDSRVRFAVFGSCPLSDPSLFCTAFAGGGVTAGTAFELGTIGPFVLGSDFKATPCLIPGQASAYCVSDEVIAKGSGSDTATDAPTLAFFTGPGTVNVSYQNTYNTFSPLVHSSSFTATARISYIYEPLPAVPEPSTVILFALGAAALGLRYSRAGR